MQVDFALFKVQFTILDLYYFTILDLYYLTLTKEEICIVSNVMLFKWWRIVALSREGNILLEKWWVMPQLFVPAFNISCTKCTLGVGKLDYVIFSLGERETFRLGCSFSVCRICGVPFISSFKPRFWVRIALYTVSDAFALTGKLKLITRAIPRVGRAISHRRCRKCVILLYLTVLGTRRHVTRYPKQHGRHIGIFQTDTTAFLEPRGF